MNKAVMLSIRPQWCEKIASGEKTIEVRKTRPKLETPFKCYIYCTNNNTDNNPRNIWRRKDRTGFEHILNGKVIGEFSCDSIFPIWDGYAGNNGDDCLSFDERENYLNGEMGYGWHISDLVIYDKLRYLGEFGINRPSQSWRYVEEC
jgi:hypothetical protein|nr:MAG TPA: hypothetical protein [Caudoviricetes sp.]